MKQFMIAAALIMGATAAHAQMQPTQPDAAATPLPAPSATATPAPTDPTAPEADAASTSSTNDAVTTGSGEATTTKADHKKHKREKPKA